VNPAAISYGPLLNVIQGEVRPIIKALEIYATDSPPADYRMELEVEGVRRVADEFDSRSFHLVGYSTGGTISLAFLAKYPERVKSLALIEPGRMGDEADSSPEFLALNSEFDQMLKLPLDQRMAGFFRLLVRPGVSPPQLPPGPPPPWMAKRPAALEVCWRAFRAYKLNHERLRTYYRPVYYAYGSLSNPIWGSMAKTLAGLFPNIHIELYEGLHHMNAPHRAEPERFAWALRELWRNTEEAA
jgi:pimeloyl-ACP methyl ester carboxylesterase